MTTVSEYWALEASSAQDLVTPRCGRLVTFTSGPENLHGVTQVASGTR